MSDKEISEVMTKYGSYLSHTSRRLLSPCNKDNGCEFYITLYIKINLTDDDEGKRNNSFYVMA